MLRLAHEFGVALVAALCPLPGRLDRLTEGVVACDETMDASVLVYVQEPRDVEQSANTGPRSRFQQQVVAFGDDDGGVAVHRDAGGYRFLEIASERRRIHEVLGLVPQAPKQGDVSVRVERVWSSLV